VLRLVRLQTGDLVVSLGLFLVAGLLSRPSLGAMERSRRAFFRSKHQIRTRHRQREDILIKIFQIMALVNLN
jgi:hypothetical protein